jgi:hypothetical protein
MKGLFDPNAVYRSAAAKRGKIWAAFHNHRVYELPKIWSAFLSTAKIESSDQLFNREAF